MKIIKKYNYEVIVNKESKCGLDGLPDVLENLILESFTKEEIIEDPEGTLQCLFEAEQRRRPSIIHLPENSLYLKKIKKNIFNKGNPYEKYRTLKRINSGSSGQIYKIERKSDQLGLALKMISPIDQDEYDEIQNETSIMKLCQKEDNIIQCYDAYDYDGKLWIYMELMDIGAMTDIVIENEGKIEEEVCQYILR